MTSAESHREPNDPGTTMAVVAAEIVADWHRKHFARLERIRLSTPAISPQILGRYGLTHEMVRTRVTLFTAARRGDEAARRELMRRWGCRVWQAANLPR